MKLATLIPSLIACFHVAPVANATTMDAYLRATGANQGVFKGGGESTVFNIPVISLTTSIHAGDENTGKNTVTIEFSQADAKEFLNAANSKELITKIEVFEIRPSATKGMVDHYFNIVLSKATVSGVVQRAGPAGGPALVEFVTLTFDDLNMTYPVVTTTASDSWESRV
jgi:hypothetical protein